MWQMKLGVKHGEFCGWNIRICTKLFYVQVRFFACFREQGLSQFCIEVGEEERHEQGKGKMVSAGMYQTQFAVNS